LSAGFLLCSLLLLSVSAAPAESIPLYNLFNNAVNRAQHLHQLAADIYKEFERTLLPGMQRQLSESSALSGCYSDSIPAPTGKDETQQRSDGDLLRISSALIQSWVFPLKTFSEAFSNSLMFGTSDRIFEKLEDLSEGIDELMRVRSSAATGDAKWTSVDHNTSRLRYIWTHMQNIRQTDAARMKNYGLLACFKKDMHKVETYLKVTKCRRFVESNCTL
uniref:Growth hormone 1 n=1 Tax=Scleropages formosus TaxID=113540 RepID=A0A8C9SB74_SCLFO